MPKMGSVKDDLERRQSDLKSEELNNLYKFVADYYKHQGIIAEDSFEEFINILKSPIDDAFYVSSYSRQALKLKLTFKNLLNSVKTGNNFFVYPISLSWFKNECVWRWKIREDFIKNEEEQIELRKFLQQQIACENILKQDVLDMFPVTLLNVNHTQKVLDMSGYANHKFYQLADFLHLQDEVEGDGLFVIVESDLMKCISMSESFSRHSSPRFAIINLNTKLLPLLHSTSKDGEEHFLTFDRVLCFYPSSNDGLARNNPETVRGWTWSASLSHHGNLCEMLNSGLGVLKIGGRLVYAINSMNPIEGEAVISTVLYQQKGSVELVDISSELPDIIYEKGKTKWEVLTNQKWYSKADDVPEYLWPQVWTSMFPLPPEVTNHQHLDRCIRILPHKQNTSGMFLGVLTRVEYLEDAVMREEEQMKKKWEEEEALRMEQSKEEAKALEEKKRRRQERKKRKMEMKEAKLKEKKMGALMGNATGVENSDTVRDTKHVTTLNESNVESTELILPLKERKESEEEMKQEVEVKEMKREEYTEETAKVHASSLDKTILEKKGEEMIESQGQESNWVEEQIETKEVMEEKKVDKDENDFTQDLLNVGHIHDAPVRFCDSENPFLMEIKTFYGLSSDFPQHLLYVKIFENVPFYYYLVSEALNKILQTNLPKHRFVSTGVKLFSYISQEDLDCKFRITPEGAKYILPFMSKQVVQVPKKDILAILSKPEVELYNLSPSSQNKISKMGRGGFVISYEPSSDDELDDLLVLSCLRTGGTYRCFLSEYERFFYLRLLGVPFKCYDDSNVTVREALLNFANQFKNAKA